jgi:hypothetical protein
MQTQTEIRSKRMLLNEHVRRYVTASKVKYSFAWAGLYKLYRDVYHVDLVTCARNKKKDVLDFAEEAGYLPGLLRLAEQQLKIN